MIYFMQPTNDKWGPIKIGYTNDLVFRHRALQFQYGRKFKILKSIPGTLEDEAAIHERFARLRLMHPPTGGRPTEQFRPGPELAEFLKDCAVIDIPPDGVAVVPLLKVFPLPNPDPVINPRMTRKAGRPRRHEALIIVRISRRAHKLAVEAARVSREPLTDFLSRICSRVSDSILEGEIERLQKIQIEGPIRRISARESSGEHDDPESTRDDADYPSAAPSSST
jgi:uncharacterized protein (DUF1778 family)